MYFNSFLIGILLFFVLQGIKKARSYLRGFALHMYAQIIRTWAQHFQISLTAHKKGIGKERGLMSQPICSHRGKTTIIAYEIVFVIVSQFNHGFYLSFFFILNLRLLFY